MAVEKLLTIRDVALYLGVSEREVIDLAEAGAIPAYKVGGVYLRFKRHEIEAYKKQTRPAQHKAAVTHHYSFQDRAYDFLYFNDFYIFSAILILLMVWMIIHG